MRTLKIFVPGCTAFLLILSLFVQAAPVSAVATIRYVAPGGVCGGATPCYANVQDAVSAAVAGDEIRVAAGTYTGVNSNGGHAQHLYINKALTIRGGYTTADWTTPDPVTNVTELQAQTLGRVVYVEQAATVTLAGLRLTYGNATGLGGHTTYQGTKDAGSAVYTYKATLTLENCQVLHSSLPKEGIGGGLYARETVLTIDNTRFEDNTSGNGGAAYLYKSTSTIQNSQFVNNQMSGLQSGDFGVHVEEGALTFTGNIVQDNFTTDGAGSQFGLNKVNPFTVSQNDFIGTSSGSQHQSGVGIDYSTGTFSENYVANHRNAGVSVTGGYVNLVDNEIAYNNGWPAAAGGGVVFNPNPLYASQFIMTGNRVHHNYDRYLATGGGVYLNTSADNSAYVSGNIIEDNQSGDGSGALTKDGVGGGVDITGNYATLTGNIVRRNIANGFLYVGTYKIGGLGGGIYMSGNSTLINNIITDNQALFAGSGVYASGSTPYLYHNTIANNIYAGGDGSGVYSTESGSNMPGQPRLYNNIISNQTVGVYADKQDVTSLAFVDNVLWYGNGSDTGGPGTVFVNNPHSGDPLYLDAANGNYHIGTGSAAIDIGTNANIPAGITSDADDKPRIANGIVDLGAYENQDNFLLSVSKLGGGSGIVTSNPAGLDCGADCTETFAANTPVTLTAVADPGSTFMSWSGDPDCADGQVTLTEDTSCEARFYLPVTLTITKSGNGSGTVTSTPAGINCGADCTEIYDTGTEVTLKPVAASGSAFARWTGDADCSDGNITLSTDLTCTAVFKKLVTATFRSVGANDGWVLEKAETSNTGGSINVNAGTFYLGDDASDRQYRAVLHFNTATLPDAAVITGITLKVKKQAIVGTDPFNTHGNILVDIRKGAFSNNNALQTADFQATANKSGIATIRKTLAAGWYSGSLLKTAFPFVNLEGVTQFRLRFSKDDNDDHGADTLKLFSGNALTASRPMLVVTYYVP
jgi:hypothetical protein